MPASPPKIRPSTPPKPIRMRPGAESPAPAPPTSSPHSASGDQAPPLPPTPATDSIVLTFDDVPAKFEPEPEVEAGACRSSKLERVPSDVRRAFAGGLKSELSFNVQRAAQSEYFGPTGAVSLILEQVRSAHSDSQSSSVSNAPVVSGEPKRSRVSRSSSTRSSTTAWHRTGAGDGACSATAETGSRTGAGRWRKAAHNCSSLWLLGLG